MTPRDRKKGRLIGWIIALGAVILLSLPVGTYADDVDSETCLACHDGYEKTLAATVHRLGSKTGQIHWRDQEALLD